MATDEATSESFAMPWATIHRDPVIDHVVPLDEVGALIVELVRAMSDDQAPASSRRRTSSG